MRVAIQRGIGQSKESRHDHRVHGVLLVVVGRFCRRLVALVDEDGTTAQRRADRFERGGLDARREGVTAGWPRTLGATQWRKLQPDPCETPGDFRLTVTLCVGPALCMSLERPKGGWIWGHGNVNGDSGRWAYGYACPTIRGLRPIC